MSASELSADLSISKQHSDFEQKFDREPLQTRKPQTYWSMAIQSIQQDKLTLTAVIFLALLVLIALLAQPISQIAVGVGPNQTNVDNTFARPYFIPYVQWRMGTDIETAPRLLGESNGITHWLGTDQLGRDQFTRLLYGGRVSLSVGFAAALISFVIGVALGLMAGYFGGVVDDLIMWFINTLSSIPTLYILIIITALFKPNPFTLTLFLGFFGWLGTARFMRGNVFKVREMDYAMAARSIGLSDARVMFLHILPNSLPIIIVLTAVSVGGLILTESALSFLGLGIQPPTSTWGSMLNRGLNFIFLQESGRRIGFHLIWPPGLFITLTVLCFYLVGDGLRDALDPTLKNKS